MRLYTIGFAGKTAREFFSRLSESGVKTLIDVRLRPDSQLTGFAKGRDLPYFLENLVGIGYERWEPFCPSAKILDHVRRDVISWPVYAERYLELLKERKAVESVDAARLENACLLCSESTDEFCHRRLAAEALKARFPDLELIAL